MGDLVLLQSIKGERNASVEAAWQRFVEAQKKSQDTLRLEDGLIARRACREFLELFDVRARK